MKLGEEMKNRILIIDDEHELCWALEKALQKDGYDVLSATDGLEGLNIFYEQKFDVVILDIKIGEINGLDILKQIRDVNPRVPVIVMTGYSTMEMAMKALDREATVYLTKPFKVSKLRETIKEMLARSGEGKPAAVRNNRLY